MNVVTLEDKFDLDADCALISGTQALVRLSTLQHKLDAEDGLNTGAYISGYRGSPLGGLDSTLWKESARLKSSGIVFQPAVNEDLAATAVWGSQQFDLVDNPTVDGVFAMWYGKGPGVDRSGDPMKHGNLFGAHRHGGVLVVYGDDHPGKSSTVAHQSEQALAANSIPTFYPANVSEILEYGLAGWALSRYSGLWVGLKTVNETVEQTATVDFSALRQRFPLPEGPGLPQAAYQHSYNPQGDEVMLTRHRLPLAKKFLYASGLDRVALDGGAGGLGIVTSGKAYGDVCQALTLLGIDDQRAQELGISIYKVACIWPVEPRRLTDFARGRNELLFVEEKKPFVQSQAAEILYSLEDRPVLTGKSDPAGEPLLPGDVQLQALTVALAIAARLEANGQSDTALDTVVASLKQKRADIAVPKLGGLARTPFFCSGCPHNTSTRVPEGSVAGAGIGCHGMSYFSRTDMLPFSQMGGEGVTWLGMTPFTETNHVFQNLGDGTYFHSGMMAIRAAVAAKANITYKILFNDAVAMTGGQPIDGPISVPVMAKQVLDEGIARCVVVSDNPDAYRGAPLPPGVSVHHRDHLEHVQKTLRDVPGCTVLIYEQTCATEKRRRRKRNLMPAAPARVVINAEVCEGCGDCSVQSNCLSIQPRETELGRKRKVDQFTCNQDMSCVNGFCPSFVSVVGGTLRKPKGSDISEGANLPEPDKPALSPAYSIMIAGIGGTGVISVGSILAMAAHIEKKHASVYDMTGLAQKGGAVYSHLRIAASADAIGGQRIGPAEADLVLGFDVLAGLAGDALTSIDKGRTRFLANREVAPTAAFQRDQTLVFDADEPISQVQSLVGADRLLSAHFADVAVRTCGDAIAGNLMAVGFAYQAGWLPLTAEAIQEAIELNGVAVPMNKRAFQIGRQLAADPQSFALQPDATQDGAQTTAQSIEANVARLTDYQNKGYARRYHELVQRAVDAETRLGALAEEGAFAAAVARTAYRLMAYKDEYEVARLHARPEFMREIEAQFEGDYSLRFNLAPPLLSRPDPLTGKMKKRQFGPWILPVFRALAKFKGLRGTWLDPFGYTVERRDERALIDHYEELVKRLSADLTGPTHAQAVELAELADMVRGYGHVKEANLKKYWELERALLDALDAPVPEKIPAE